MGGVETWLRKFEIEASTGLTDWVLFHLFLTGILVAIAMFLVKRRTPAQSAIAWFALFEGTAWGYILTRQNNTHVQLALEIALLVVSLRLIYAIVNQYLDPVKAAMFLALIPVISLGRVIYVGRLSPSPTRQAAIAILAAASVVMLLRVADAIRESRARERPERGAPR